MDDGKGFDFEKINKGNGLDSMNNRISILNGKLQIMPNHPKGTIIKFEIKI
jgi:signal transduction histidine kinase